jgi:hypothetical protein
VTRGLTAWERVWFSVPDDFHTHNDSVAAALLTLVGRQYPAVTFNFAISRRCADLLADYYQLTEIGPVDDALEPRRHGRYVGLNLSGGCDSAALWCLLTDHLQLEFKCITSEYRGRFASEVSGFETFPRHLRCVTNLRTLGFDGRGRFHAAVPLLYADYLDLRGLASGHTVRHTFEDTAEFRAGLTPGFVKREASYLAGGLEELHLCRGVHTLGMLRVLVQARPDATEAAARASGTLQTGKGLEKAVLMRWLCAQHGWPMPHWLAELVLPDAPPPAARPRPSVRSLFIAKYLGLDVAERVLPGISRHDLSFLDNVSLAFLERHHPAYVPYMPAELRQPLLDAYAHFGIAAYEESDWKELDALDDFIANCAERMNA